MSSPEDFKLHPPPNVLIDGGTPEPIPVFMDFGMNRREGPPFDAGAWEYIPPPPEEEPGWVAFEYQPATDVDWDQYRIDVLQMNLNRGQGYIRLRVVGCSRDHAEDAEVCGPPSEYSDPIYIPEAPQWMALPACILLLLGMKWLARALGRLP